MKCPVCQYEHEEELVHERGAHFYKTIKGDETFINIKGNFTRVKEYDYAPNTITEVQLFGCPKCGIVKFEE